MCIHGPLRVAERFGSSSCLDQRICGERLHAPSPRVCHQAAEQDEQGQTLAPRRLCAAASETRGRVQGVWAMFGVHFDVGR